LPDLPNQSRESYQFIGEDEARLGEFEARLGDATELKNKARVQTKVLQLEAEFGV
jgi:hypothetical protein